MPYTRYSRIVAALGISLAAVAAVAQFPARYSSGSAGSSVPHSMALDSAGDCYVAGETATASDGQDIVLLKYSSSGTLLWSQTYDGPDHGDDAAYSIVLDSSGNAYIAGETVDTGSNLDGVIIKYDPSGARQWVRKYDGPGASSDFFGSIAIYADTYVAVTGTATDASFNFEGVTLLYDTSGVKQWVRLSAPSGSIDVENSKVVFDGTGNLIVGGVLLLPSNSQYSLQVLKYSSAGALTWRARYTGTGNGGNIFGDVGVDPAGDIYLLGSTSAATGNYVMSLNKYNAAGVRQWTQAFGSTGIDQFANGLAIDSGGNIILAGYHGPSIMPVSTDFVTVKYDSSGTKLWQKTYSLTTDPISNDGGLAIALDGSDNIYVAGFTESAAPNFDYDFATLMYSPSGSRIWVKTTATGGTRYDAATQIKVTSGGSVYVAGYSSQNAVGGGPYDIVVDKY